VSTIDDANTHGAIVVAPALVLSTVSSIAAAAMKKAPSHAPPETTARMQVTPRGRGRASSKSMETSCSSFAGVAEAASSRSAFSGVKSWTLSGDDDPTAVDDVSSAIAVRRREVRRGSKSVTGASDGRGATASKTAKAMRRASKLRHDQREILRAN
jgi:hypothetical protein